MSMFDRMAEKGLGPTVRKVKPGPRFDGPVYEPEHDQVRLTGQVRRVFKEMKDGIWRTLDEISELTGDPVASISAQLRHLRKERFGSHTVDKRPRGDRGKGLWEYRLIVNDKAEVSLEEEGKK